MGLMKRAVDLTAGGVMTRMIRLAVPMLGGTFAIMAFNLADTYFVSKLSTRHLAAMGFTFPVVMVVGGLARGVGMGASALIAGAIGENNTARVRRLTLHALLLAVFMVISVMVLGLAFQEPLFRLLGADDTVMPLILEYMTIWFCGLIVVIVPMMGNDLLRAAGDTVFPSLMMIAAAVLNVALDPILIFGLCGAPRMELKGAIWATVLSRAITLFGVFAAMIWRYHMIELAVPRARDLLRSWRGILHIGVPTGVANLLQPLSLGCITRIVAGFGLPAVAAFGAGLRIEMFAFLIPMSLASRWCRSSARTGAPTERTVSRCASSTATGSRWCGAWGWPPSVSPWPGRWRCCSARTRRPSRR